MSKRIDIAVIGGGPAGLSAAVNAAARGKTVRLLSSGKTILDRAEKVDNYLGFYNINGGELMNRFEQHAEALGITIEKGRVTNLVSLGDSFLINFSNDIVEANAVILTTGVIRVRSIPGESELLGRGVSYCATCDGMLYKGSNVVVWGVSADSVEEANFLNSIGVNVTFISKEARPKELHENIVFKQGSVSAIKGLEHVEAVTLGDEEIEADGVFILRDALAPSSLVEGLEMDDGYVRVNSKMETNIPGLYAAGDCTGMPLQIAKAVGEGLIAAQQAAKHLDTAKV